jgi:LL-diaminopimelate aminotransferase
MFEPSERIKNLPENFFAGLEQRIHALQQTGADVIRLDIGSPDMPPAAHIIQTLTTSAQRPDAHGYQPHAGLPALRQAWAGMYQRVHEVELDPNKHLLPLIGSKEGIFNLISAWINPGDMVLVPDPAYMTYVRGTLFAGGEVFHMPVLAQNPDLPDLDSIPETILRRARMLWLNYPNNPTGAVANRAFFEEAVEFSRQHGLLLCHDAAYTQVCFDGYRAPSILEVPGAADTAVEFNSLSKSHNLPGWRLGAAVGNPVAIQALFRLKTNLDSGHFRPVLEAAVAALNGDQGWLEARNQVYRTRRDLVLQALDRLGLPAKKPLAAIYIWSPIPPGWNTLDFVNSVLEKTHISLTPGEVFGPRGAGYVRIALTSPTEQIEAAMQRLAGWRG